MRNEPATGVDDASIGVNFSRQSAHQRRYAHFEAAELLPLKSLGIETSGLVKGENVERQPHNLVRSSSDELNDSACRAYPLPRKERVAVPRRIAEHLMELRSSKTIDAIVLIQKQYPV